MSNNFSPIQKLDFVLTFLANSNIPYYLYSDWDITKKIKELTTEFNNDDAGRELISVLEKLNKDGYVDITERLNDEGFGIQKSYSYKINFQGMYFISHEDGYQGLDRQRKAQLLRETERENRVRQLEIFQQEQSLRIDKLTRIAIVVSALLLLWEIVKYFLFEHWLFYKP